MVIGPEAGVGKTLVTAALVQSLCRMGIHAIGMTPAPKGILDANGNWRSEELQQLASVSAFNFPPSALCPSVLPGSHAPRRRGHGKEPALSLEAIVDTFQILSTWADAVAVDDSFDVGQFAGRKFDGADVASALNLPLLMVVGMHPGCIERAVANAQALTRRGLECAGWIANQIDPAAAADRIADLLRQRMPAPCLGSIPRLLRLAPAHAAQGIDMQKTLMALAR
jgi:dethiobiotin synthetase